MPVEILSSDIIIEANILNQMISIDRGTIVAVLAGISALGIGTEMWLLRRLYKQEEAIEHFVAPSPQDQIPPMQLH